MSERLIHEAVARRARETPDAVALAYRGGRLTYRELDSAANAMAGRLGDRGVSPGHIVPVILPRSPELAATLLAVLKRGGAYAAFDHRWPPARLRSLFQKLGGAPLYIADRPYPDIPCPLYRPPGGPVYGWPETLDRGRAKPNGYERITPDAPASVFFTSGTSGTPKGVVSPHRATTRLFLPDSPLAFGPGTVMPLASAVSWDGPSLELWGMLTTGGKVVVVEDDCMLPNTLRAIVVAEGVNTLWLTAALFNLFVDVDINCLVGLDTVYVGGERLSPVHVRRFLKRFPETSVVNGYGPVESCAFTTLHTITLDDCDRAEGIPLGRPVPHTQVYVRDGEICVGGDGLALGYLDDAALTAAKFVEQEQEQDGTRTRVYRTGDAGWTDEDGILYFGGRLDRQVKIRGFRIEPSEIETAAANLAGVQRSVVVPVPGGEAGVFDRIALFYTVASPAPEPAAVRNALSETLPAHAIPHSVRRIERIPMTANGKVDGHALLTLLAEEK